MFIHADEPKFLNTDEALSIINAVAFPSDLIPTGSEYRQAYSLKVQMLSDMVEDGYECECRVVDAIKKATASQELARLFGSEHLAAEFLDKILDKCGPSEMASVILTLMGYGYEQINADYQNGRVAPF